MRRTGRLTRIIFSALAVTAAAGCASAPRPVPTGGQPVASVEGAGLLLTVPRLDPGAFPDDILDVAAAVFVAIENRGQAEIQIALEDFSLTGPDGMGYQPVPAQQLAAAPPRPAAGDRMSLFTEGAPIYAQRGFVPPPSPAYRSGGYGLRGGYSGGLGYRGGYYRGGYIGGPRVWVGPGWGWGGGWGWGWGWGGPWWWGPSVYVRTRDDALRNALQPGRLPAGGRTAGFLYFPRRPMAEGSQLLLRWQARDAQSRAVVADMRIPLELDAE